MKTKPLIKVHETLPIYQRGKAFILVKSFPEIGQKQIPLQTDNKKTAEARAKVFLRTIEIGMGFDAALKELNGGKPIVKKGQDLNFEEISEIYKTKFIPYLEENEMKTPREVSIKGYLSALKRLMGDKTLSKVNIAEQRKTLLNGSTDPIKKRSVASEIRNAKAIFSKEAMAFYKSQNYTVINPFENFKKTTGPKVEQYAPLPEKVRSAIWEQCEDQSPEVAILILLGLGLGFRRNESEHCRLSWFSIQDDFVIVSIQDGPGFSPKSGERRTFKITKSLYERMLNHRNKILASHTGKKSLDNDPFFVPVFQRKGKGTRLWGRFKAVSKWLKSMGVDARQGYHLLRKEAGSLHYSQTKNLLETSRFLGHSDPAVTSSVYAGIIDPAIIEGMEKKVSPEEQAAKLLGITLEQVNQLKNPVV